MTHDGGKLGPVEVAPVAIATLVVAVNVHVQGLQVSEPNTALQ